MVNADVKADKGSRMLLGKWVNKDEKGLADCLFEASPSLLAFREVGAKPVWKSPLESNNYREYRDDFLDHYDAGQSKQLVDTIRQYWPSGGPVWDGLAVIKGRAGIDGFILVEAKANIPETSSKSTAKAPASIDKIESTLRMVQAEFGSRAALKVWTQHYYQYANRLAYLYLLNKKLNIPTWLINVYFIDDDSHRETTREEWHTHLTHMYQTLDISHSTALAGQTANLFLESKVK
ncbi:hypothetical protein CR205_16330 [Alteribacter lacisalsi]|uniref:Uncharacterized protein n=1 Tax=Alteribacter lacisalsi TaxID=2045244 RepID=A0A2W0HGD3_9BACI|nr:hypothetical protein [Alteribacter lacisalsi]PYZ95942.1 hypothetical protein CR205_16330 [Alteribacter lacisalsi]